MLAQNFKTSAELRISDVEFDALVKTLGYLEREDLPGRLDLQIWSVNAQQIDCDTSACIAGWAWIFSDKKAFTDILSPNGTVRDHTWMDRRPKELSDLFVSVTQSDKDAPFALRNYLTHGEPRWAEALSA